MASKKTGRAAAKAKPSPAKKTATKTPAKGPARSATGSAEEKPPEGFVPAGKGYFLGLRDNKLVCRNPKGQQLGSVPKDLRAGEVGEQLLAAVDFLKAHEREAAQNVEGWMLRSLPTPASVLLAVWADEAYRRALENLVVTRTGEAAHAASSALEGAGFLKGVDPRKGIGLVNLDGETVWEKAEALLVPHPILLGELDDLRSLAAELGLTQGVKQLFREVFTKPRDLAPDQTDVSTFRGGKFEQLSHARGAVKSLGYRSSGGWAVCRIFEEGQTCEARFWIGADDPMDEAHTDNLNWVSASGDPIPVKDVPPIAFSEGMRMASAIYGKRVVEKKEGEEDA